MSRGWFQKSHPLFRVPGAGHDGRWQLVLLWLRALRLFAFMESECRQREQHRPSNAREVQGQEWVVMRPTSRRLRRRKAVSEVSLPGSGHSSPSACDPKRK